MEFVCPQPKIWHKVHQRLEDFYQNNKNTVKTAPPIPLILNGWIYSTDYQKKLRWEETIKWAQEYGCSNLIPTLKSDDKYEVTKIIPTFIQEEDPYGSDR